MRHWIRNAFLIAATVTAFASTATAQEPPKDGTEKKPDTTVQKPAEKPAEKDEAREILAKTLAAYSAAKSYQGTWSYTLERGAGVQKLQAEIKAKGPTKLFFHLGMAPGQKPIAESELIPEITAVLDGKAAWSENATVKLFYKIELPKTFKATPLMFFPQISGTSSVVKEPDVQADGKTFYVIKAETRDGGTTKMEIDSTTFRIRRIVAEASVALVKMTSTIAIEKEIFDGEVADNVFTFKPAKGSKEMPAPPGAGAIFGQAG